MQAENDDDLDGGQRSSEVKWGKRKKYTSSPRYWHTSIGQYWTIFAFQYCELLNNTSTFLRT